MRSSCTRLPRCRLGRGGVEAAVVGDRFSREELFERCFIRRDVDEPAPVQLIPDVVERRVVGLCVEDL